MISKISNYSEPPNQEEELATIEPITHDTIFDIKVVEACREGNDIAWKNFFDAHFEYVFRTARRLGTTSNDTEDVVHEIFIEASKNISSFSGEDVRAWLYPLIAEAVDKHHRQKRKQDRIDRLKSLFLRPSEHTSEGAGSSISNSATVSTVLRYMKPQPREVFALFEIEGIEGEEISRRLGITTEQMWKLLHQARKSFIKIATKKGCLYEGFKK